MQTMAMNPPIRFFTGEKRNFVTGHNLPTIEWARQNFRLVAGPLKGRNWNPEIVPYAKGIMEMWDKPYVRTIFIVAPSQSGKTTIAYACLASALAKRPDAAAIGMPDQEAAERIFESRLIPAFNASPAMRNLLQKSHTALQKREVRLKDGTVIYALWAGSESRMSSISLQYLLIDEEDIYQDKNAVKLMLERTIAYKHTCKILRFSKPRGSEKESTIWNDMLAEAQAVFEWEARCPACGTYQIMDMDNIRPLIDRERDPRTIVRKKLGRYICPVCKYAWSDYIRNQAVARGRWKAESCPDRPTVVGFHIPSWISPFISLSQVLADYFAAHASADPKKLQQFDNNHRARPYKIITVETQEDKIRKMILDGQNDRPEQKPMIVPAEAVALTCGIDVQMTGFWFVVRAWAKWGESWLIQYGWLNTWDDVEKLVFETYYPVEGRESMLAPIWRTAIDTGGGELEEGWSKTDEVYTWLQQNALRGNVFGVKGASKRMPVNAKPTTIALEPGKNRNYQMGKLTIYLLDTHALKDAIHYRLKPDSRQPMWLHSETGDDYIKQILAEKKRIDKNGREYWDAGSRPNHLLDCEVYAAACADPVWTPSLRLLDEPAWISKQAESRPQQQSTSPIRGRSINPWANRRTSR